MPPLKSAPLGLRLEPRIKWALTAAAKREHRSLANMVEWLVLDYCERAGVRIPEQHGLALGDDDGPTNVEDAPRRGRR